MTLDQIIKLSKQVGSVNHMGSPVLHRFTSNQLKDFADLISEYEREKCAELCEDLFCSDGDWCAKQIRTIKND